MGHQPFPRQPRQASCCCSRMAKLDWTSAGVGLFHKVRIFQRFSHPFHAGWVTFREASGQDCHFPTQPASYERYGCQECFKLAKLLVCKQSIALTTSFDIATGKVGFQFSQVASSHTLLLSQALRKLDVTRLRWDVEQG